MKKIISVFIFLLLLLGCRTNTLYFSTIDDINNKIEDDQTFVFIITLENCSNCNDVFENTLNKYIKYSNYNFYEVEITAETSDGDKAKLFDFVDRYPYPEVHNIDENLGPQILAPSLYIFEDGALQMILVGNEITVDNLDNFLN